MNVKLESSWLELLADQFEQPYFTKIKDFLLKEKNEKKSYLPSWL